MDFSPLLSGRRRCSLPLWISCGPNERDRILVRVRQGLHERKGSRVTCALEPPAPAPALTIPTFTSTAHILLVNLDTTFFNTTSFQNLDSSAPSYNPNAVPFKFPNRSMLDRCSPYVILALHLLSSSPRYGSIQLLFGEFQKKNGTRR